MNGQTTRNEMSFYHEMINQSGEGIHENQNEPNQTNRRMKKIELESIFGFAVSMNAAKNSPEHKAPKITSAQNAFTQLIVHQIGRSFVRFTVVYPAG